MTKYSFRLLFLVFACVCLWIKPAMAETEYIEYNYYENYDNVKNIVEITPEENLIPITARRSTPGSHRGAVTAILRDEDGRILSAAEDGFLQIWNEHSAEERFQLSSFEIQTMVLRPGLTQVAIVERESSDISRISAWDYLTRKKLFTQRFRGTVTSINYSGAGSFLIVSLSGPEGVVFLNSETGERLNFPHIPGPISLSATGFSERIMLSYQPTGILSYWDLDEGNELERLLTPTNIRNIILFGNNRFLGGFDFQGLIILDAVTGMVITRDHSKRHGYLFIENPSSSRFFFITSDSGVYTVYHMDVCFTGALSTLSRRVITEAGIITSSIYGTEGNIILGTNQGTLWLMDSSGERVLVTEKPKRIIDFAVSSSKLAFITESGALGFIPLDYAQFNDGEAFTKKNILDTLGTLLYTNVTGDPDSKEPRFLLWQRGRSIPSLISLADSESHLSLGRVPLHFPLRSAAIFGNRILFLNSAGMVSILNADNGEIVFTHSVTGAVDVTFAAIDTIIFGRSVIAGNPPFITVNILTNETVALAYPALVGVRVYRSGSGTVYGVTVNQTAGNIQTSIIKLDLSNPANSQTLVRFDGEDLNFAMAESAGNFTTNLGGGPAVLHRSHRASMTENPAEKIFLERSTGLPVKIASGKIASGKIADGKAADGKLDAERHWFIVLDGEGHINWHDNQTGELLASLRFYSERWVLSKFPYPRFLPPPAHGLDFSGPFQWR